MTRLICLFRTRMAWPYPISGHRYIEPFDSAEVWVGKCMECGHTATHFYYDVDEQMERIIRENKLK